MEIPSFNEGGLRAAEPAEPTGIASGDQLETHLWEVRGHFLAGGAFLQQALPSGDDGPALYRGRALNALAAYDSRGAHIDSAQPIAC